MIKVNNDKAPALTTNNKVAGKQSEIVASNNSGKLADATNLKEASILLAKIKNIPDADEKLVAEIKSKISNGNYKIDSEQLAQAILKRSLAEDL